MLSEEQYNTEHSSSINENETSEVMKLIEDLFSQFHNTLEKKDIAVTAATNDQINLLKKEFKRKTPSKFHFFFSLLFYFFFQSCLL